MERFWSLICCAFLLAGCAAPPKTPEGPPPDSVPAEIAAVEYVDALTIPLAELEPYEPWRSMEPDVAGPETMGEVLCDETLPGGARVVCY